MFDFKFDWKPDMMLGVEDMDTQHKQLFSIGRDLEQLIQIGCIGVTDKQLLEVVCKLRDFSSYHFYTEEALMTQIGYQRIKEHRKLHQKIEKELMEIDMPTLKKEPLKTLQIIRDEIQNQIFSHTMGEDEQLAKAYKDYLKNGDQKGKAEVKKKEDPYESMYGPKLFELDVSVAYLFKEQSQKGRIVLVNKEKTKGILKMSTLERNIFFTDVFVAAGVLKKALSPDAFDYAYYGDIDEQMIMHIVPKYKDSLLWGKPFVLEGEGQYPSEEELQKIAEQIQSKYKN